MTESMHSKNGAGETRPPSGPLKGVTVLDFGSFVAGSFAGVLMGDFGANVVKVEPLEGEPTRGLGPFLAGESRAFISWNRNKRGLAVDLTCEAGQAVIHELVAKADVVIENFRPGITEKLKIDYPTLSAINPRLIYCSSTGFGSKGPYRNRTAYDSILQAMGGVAMGNAIFAERITLTSVLVADFGAAFLAYGAINAALLHRERTGEGQLVETSLLQSIMTIQPHGFFQALETEAIGPAGAYPYRLFETSDGQLCIAALTPKSWKALCEGMELPELWENDQYKTNVLRVEHAEELKPILEARFRERSTTEWVDLLAGLGVPCGPVQAWDAFLDDPQVRAMGMCEEIGHSQAGKLKISGVPVHFEKSPGRIQRSAPTLGEHSEQVLADFGFEASRIEELLSKGTVKSLNSAKV